MFSYTNATSLTTPVTWTAELNDLDGNGNWDPGETLKVSFKFYPAQIPSSGSDVYFQFVLPDGIYRDSTFTASV